MNVIVKNIGAVVAGVFIGSVVNMGLINISGSVIPPPEGADLTTMEGIKDAMHLFELKHFIFPFLAHALGTFVGAFFAALIAGTHKMKFALGIGLFFLLGGITNVLMLPSPAWFAAVDIILAYFPMAWLGGKLEQKIGKK